MPTFKAGVHVGEATVGEIGIITKDIVFSGDVLNTRMSMGRTYASALIGEIQLRGKAEAR